MKHLRTMKHLRIIASVIGVTILLALAACGGGAGTGSAAAGSLDTSFGIGGIVTTPIGSSNDSIRAAALQSDGKIVVAGASINGANFDFAVGRYRVNGSLDTDFATDGKAITPISSGWDGAAAVDLQADGKIMVAGFSSNASNYDMTLVCYNANGSLNADFGSDGKVTTAFGSGDDFASAVAVQGDGMILVAGSSHNGSNFDFALVRHKTDGSLDTGFGTGGKLITAIGSGDDLISDVILQSDGKIVAVGYSETGGKHNFALVRYHSNGSLDTLFGTGGTLSTAIGSGHDEISAVALQSDNKIVVAGYSHNGSNNDFALARYHSDGSLDTSFGTGGKRVTAIGDGHDEINAVVLQSDNKIVVAGYSHNGSNNDFALARYHSDGSLDTSFGTGGKRITAIGNGHDVANAVLLQSDGSIVAAGFSHNGTNDDFALVRYHP
jgi:uncharacterized delta-60 repeat protein